MNRTRRLHSRAAGDRASPVCRVLSDACAVRDHVRRNQREREEEQAHDEVPEEAMALAGGDAGGPKRDRDPDRKEHDPEDHRTKQGIEQHALPPSTEPTHKSRHPLARSQRAHRPDRMNDMPTSF